MRIDWFRVIVDLERSGYAHQRIADELLRSKGWVNNLKCVPGAEPRHRDGQALLALWSRATGRPLHDAPLDRETVRIVR
jgi:hypothetical protein